MKKFVHGDLNYPARKGIYDRLFMDLDIVRSHSISTP